MTASFASVRSVASVVACVCSCRSCDYDLCENCYVTAGGAFAERLRVSEVIERAFVAFADRPCLGFQPGGSAGASWAWLSYGRVFELMRGLGDVLHAMGVAPGRCVGVLFVVCSRHKFCPNKAAS